MDNRPYSRFLPLYTEASVKKHPYKEPIIGSIEHLDAAVYEDFINFNAKFYTTRNAVFTVAGDIDIDETREMIDYYFSAIPDKPKPEKSFSERIRYNFRDKGTGIRSKYPDSSNISKL